MHNEIKEIRGFTLVELIAVVVILGLIGLLTFPAVAGVIRGAKKDVKSVNIDTVLNAAYDYVQKYPSVLPEQTGEKKAPICVEELVICGLLKNDIYKELEGSSVAGVEITYHTTAKESSSEDGYEKYRGNYLFTYIENSKGSSSNGCNPTYNCKPKSTNSSNEK